MAAIALQSGQTQLAVVETLAQADYIAGGAISAGDPVKLNTNGHVVVAAETDSVEMTLVGIALKSVTSGLPVTVIRQGVVDNLNLTGAYGAPVYVGATSGLATTAATTGAAVGQVIPMNNNLLGTVPQKVLWINIR
jgi:hypothetical protein